MVDSPRLRRRALLLSGAAVTATAAASSTTTAYGASGRKVRKVRKVFKGRFKDPNGPDWVYLPFDVPRGTRKIHVSYEYEPNTSIPGFTTNVVDIGIFDNDGVSLGNQAGFRGWSGGARREFFLTRHAATTGYLAGPLKPGRWRVALGPYQINGAGTPYKVVVTCHVGPHTEKTFVSSPAPQVVGGTGPGWYRGDLHTHTVHSDGRWTQKELAAAAQAAGLQFIGSSDHNTSSATRTWGRHAPEGFLVVNGEEVTTRNGHWVAMGLPAGTWIDWRYRAEDEKLADFTQLVRDLGGVSIAAHPDIPVPSIHWDFDRTFAEMDAVEVWNASWDASDQSAVTNWNKALKNGVYKPAVGNSDSHNSGQTVGLAQSVMRLGSLSAAEVVQAVKGGHLWIAESSTVNLVFNAAVGGGDWVSCGDTLDTQPDDEVTVSLHADSVPGCVAQLIGPTGTGPTGVLAAAVADEVGEIHLEATLTAGDIPYVRGEVRRPAAPVGDPMGTLSAAPMVMMTNPIFTGSWASPTG